MSLQELRNTELLLSLRALSLCCLERVTKNFLIIPNADELEEISIGKRSRRNTYINININNGNTYNDGVSMRELFDVCLKKKSWKRQSFGGGGWCSGPRYINCCSSCPSFLQLAVRSIETFVSHSRTCEVNSWSLHLPPAEELDRSLLSKRSNQEGWTAVLK